MIPDGFRGSKRTSGSSIISSRGTGEMTRTISFQEHFVIAALADIGEPLHSITE